jgi:hypothetical protein
MRKKILQFCESELSRIPTALSDDELALELASRILDQEDLMPKDLSQGNQHLLLKIRNQLTELGVYLSKDRGTI